MKITKKQLMNTVESKLKSNPALRVNVKDMTALKNGRWGLHPYEIGYDNVCKAIMVYPWSGGSFPMWEGVMWVFDANKLKMPQLETLNHRIDEKL